MKVLWLSHFVPYPPKGGAPQRSYHLLSQAALRHRVTFLGLRRFSDLASPEERAEALADLATFCEAAIAEPQPASRSSFHRLVVAAVSLLGSSPYEVEWLRSRALMERVEAVAGQEAFDLVHLDTIGLVPYARPFRHLPIVINHHNVESHMAERRSETERRWWMRRYLEKEAAKIERLESRECSRHAMNIVVSDLDARRLKRVCPEARTSVVPNGVDVEYFRPRSERGHASGGLVFVGRLSWYPNRDAMVWFANEIWPSLARGRPERRATIVGKDPPQELRDIDDDRVSVTGYVDDVRPILDRASIYVCPIRTGGGTRLKILDALAMAKPLVATRMSVEGLDLEDGVHYLAAETPEEFAARVGRLEEDAELREALASAGRRVVEERYSWSVIADRLSDAYDRARGLPGDPE